MVTLPQAQWNTNPGSPNFNWRHRDQESFEQTVERVVGTRRKDRTRPGANVSQGRRISDGILL